MPSQTDTNDGAPADTLLDQVGERMDLTEEEERA